MGRVLMVTRTINYTNVKFRCANAETQAFEEHELKLSGSLSGKPEKLEKALKEELKGSNLGMPTIISAEESSDLYGMTEKDFLEHAQKLEPRKVKSDN